MKLRFLGTKGEIEEFNKKHRYHSSLLIEYKNFKLLIDYGKLHKYNLNKIRPDAILITHSHPDHVFGLKEGTNMPVYLTRISYNYIKDFPLKNVKIIKVDKWFKVGPFKIKATNVIHSIRCPAVCYKVIADKKIVYASDLIDIKDKKEFLKDIDLYIGDGASLSRGIVRRKGNKLFGHTSIKIQINWCKKLNIKKVMFTHLGKEIIEMNEKNLNKKIKEFSNGVNIKLAYDGMRINI